MTPFRRTQYLMGTTVEIVAFARDAAAREGAAAAFDVFERIERACSLHDPASELSRVNASAAEGPVAVSEDVFETIARALELAAASRGCFSVALGPLSDLWRRCADEDRFPADRELEDAMAKCAPCAIALDARLRTIAFDRPGVRIDLGGFAKGLAVDRALEALATCGVGRAMIDAGQSSIGVVEGPSDGPWRIGVRHPSAPDRLVGILSLRSTALSTSGTAERWAQIRGRRLSHLIDPRTGWPVEGAVAATVVCPSAAIAEAASKMLLLLGCREGIAHCDANGWDVDGATVRVPDGASDAVIESSDGLALDVLSAREAAR